MSMRSKRTALENSRAENGQNGVRRQKVQINVRGEMFETYEHTLSRFPRTLLGSQAKRSRFYNPIRREYYFDRDKAVFNSILFYYQSNGILSKPETVSYEIFSSELKFFQLDGFYEDSDEELDSELAAAARRKAAESLPCLRKFKRTRRNVWRFFEQPITPAERLYTKFSLILTVLSLVSLCLESLPNLPEKSDHLQNQKGNSTMPAVDYDIVWSSVEVVFTIWFTVELILRSVCAPKIAQFVLSFSFLVEITALSPLYVKIIVTSVTGQDASYVVPDRILRCLRLARLLKLKRYSVGIRLLFETIVDSREHMSLFMLCIVFNTIFFSSFVYFSEGEGESSQFTSIPATFWFTIITLSSVGYGDFVPTSAVGKLVGTFCCIGGTLAMFCFTPVLFTEFRKSWQRYYAEMLEIKAQRGEDAREDDQVHYRSQTVRLRCQDEVSQALLEKANAVHG
ncbi:potassium voltage-gated channel subfamily A member 5-like [Stylophora pistillata]|uniref:potassium voltage-gated channel subfamily A member 5-like n=1 Tax=Stylophora pistillata TaxID=50429 RepID=UPI000C045AAE|nr:potassium voltage-gated channel subfamily A member 5-like [Stylophora pistillata]